MIMAKLKLVFSYMKDKQVAFYKKALIVGSVLYFILPVDIVPDFIIGLGWLDDLAVLFFIWNALKNELGDYQQKLDRLKYDQSKVIEFDPSRYKKE